MAGVNASLLLLARLLELGWAWHCFVHVILTTSHLSKAEIAKVSSDTRPPPPISITKNEKLDESEDEEL